MKIEFLWLFWIQFIIFRSYKFHFHRNRLKKVQIDVIRLHQKVIYIKKCLQEMTLKETWPPTYRKAMKTTIGSYLKVVEHHVLHSVRWCNQSEKNHTPSYDFSKSKNQRKCHFLVVINFFLCEWFFSHRFHHRTLCSWWCSTTFK